MGHRRFQFEKLRKEALADRLELLAHRGIVMADEFPDIRAALEVLSLYYECGCDLLELDDFLHQPTDGVYLNTTQQKELRYACRICRGIKPDILSG